VRETPKPFGKTTQHNAGYVEECKLKVINIPVKIPVHYADQDPMSRPPFRLPDDQARRIAQKVAVLDQDIPLDTSNHRPFVGAFIQAVRDATGNYWLCSR
jgi:hypothetical protein